MISVHPVTKIESPGTSRIDLRSSSGGGCRQGGKLVADHRAAGCVQRREVHAGSELAIRRSPEPNRSADDHANARRRRGVEGAAEKFGPVKAAIRFHWFAPPPPLPSCQTQTTNFPPSRRPLHST